mgnify:CR=1 FL=1
MSPVRKISTNQDELSGSPQQGEPVYLVVGKLRRPHGIAGEILFEMTSDSTRLFKPGKQVYIGDKKNPYTIHSLRQTNKLWLISLEGFENREQVALVRNQWVFVRLEELDPLPGDRFYHHEVLGMSVVDENDTYIGAVREILETGANDVYVVDTPDGHEILFPAVKSVVLSIDRDTRKIIVRPQEWV